MTRLITTLLATICILSAAHGADTLVLENGDQLSGSVIKIEAGVVHFRSPVLGAIQVPASKAKIVSKMAPAEKPQENKDPAPAAQPAKKSAGAKVVAEKKQPTKSPWKRRLEFGYTNQSGRKDRSDLSFRANLNWKSKVSEFRATGRYLYGNTNREKSTDHLFGSARYRRTFSGQSFGQLETRYERDPIKRINHDLQQSIGAGHNLIDNKKVQLSLGAGGAAIYRSTKTNDPGWTYAFDAFQDFSYEINRWVSFAQDLSLLSKPLSDHEFSVKINAALIGTITNSINMSMRYEYDYDNTLLPDARSNERWVTSVAYVF